jgi:hypothetical protein
MKSDNAFRYELVCLPLWEINVPRQDSLYQLYVEQNTGGRTSSKYFLSLKEGSIKLEDQIVPMLIFISLASQKHKDSYKSNRRRSILLFQIV